MSGKSDDLGCGRSSCEARAWADAHEFLSRADDKRPLDAADLERLALAAYLTGRDDRFVEVLERAHRAHLESGTTTRAVRCAFWIGLTLMLRSETGRGTGWLSSAHRLLEREALDCVERGYLLLPSAERSLAIEDFEAALATAGEAIQIGERFDDIDLIACARHVQGRALIGRGEVQMGLALLDEAMVLVTAGEMSPIMTGLVYCSVIDACQQVYALARAWEWTSALADWCAAQPQMIAFTTTCLIHRSEIMTLHGAWSEAIEEARRACERRAGGTESGPPAAALYRQAEVHRLRGDFSAAEAGYRRASQAGFEPQPGLALLRIAQGEIEAAVAAIRRVVDAATDRLERARLLSVFVEILLAAGDVENARGASRELTEIAGSFDSDALAAMAAQGRGAVALAEGDARAALGPLRHAFEAWRSVDAPYQAARVRVEAGRACRALGDDEGAELELEAARAAFERLGAVPDVERVVALTESAPARRTHGLTARERQVLALIAAGKTNRTIAGELFLSERTVERHASNIYTKLDVPSRSAATAFAFKHDLV